jgi:hypothetical protein
MSLGWLTESALIPKEPKVIEGIGRASLLGLQAAVYEREQRGPATSLKRRRRALEMVRNEGVEARDAKDAFESSKGEPTLELSSKRLIQKAQRYEAIVAGQEVARKELLVDFAVKEGGQAVIEEEEEDEQPNHCGVAIPPPCDLIDGGSSTRGKTEIPPPPCLGGNILPPPPTVSVAATASTSSSSSVNDLGASALEEKAGLGIRQAFEKPLLSTEDRAHADRLRASTELLRETLGEGRKQARGAVRERLAAMRAAGQVLS